MAPTRALVVGAGSSGITALSQLVEAGITAIAYEARSDVGGAWNFDKDPGDISISFDDAGRCIARGTTEESVPPTPMYASLRANVPTTLMAFRGQPFPFETPLFPSPEVIKTYLTKAAEPIRSLIQFNQRVVNLRWTTPADGGEQREWIVDVSSTEGGASRVEQFDFVIIANGHYTSPYIPLVEGLSGWTGKISHSRWYRDPEQFRDQTVLVIGNSASGYDITRQIAQSVYEKQSPAKVYQSRREPSSLGLPFDAPDSPPWAKAIGIFSTIEKITGNRISFDDGRELTDVDVIIFATGYLYSFPFASPLYPPFSTHPLTHSPFPPTSTPVPPVLDGGLRVHHLDARHLFYLPSPTLSFLALPLLIIPFPVAEAQSRLLAAYYSKRLPGPLKLTEGLPEDAPEERKGLVFGFPKEHDYQDELLRETGEGVGQGKWGEVGLAKRDLRKGCMGLRKAVLEY